MSNNHWGSQEEPNLLRGNQIDKSKNEVEWKKRLVEANRLDQDFLMTQPGEHEMSLHLTKTARNIGVPEPLRERLIDSILKDIYDYSILAELKTRPKVTTIWVFGDEGVEYAENGGIQRFEHRFDSNEDVYRFIEKKLSGTTFRYARNIPEVDAVLSDGSRFHIMQGSAGISQIGSDGRALTRRMPILTIRQFVYPYRLDEIVKDERLRMYISLLPQLGQSFVVAGNQGAGKTTLVNATTAFISNGYRFIVIEEAPEMQPLFRGKVVRLWNQGELNEFNFVNMIRNTKASLRMTGDVMMIGEIRDENTTWEYLRITNIGLFFTATTMHANSAEDALERLVTLGIAAEHHPPEKTVLSMIKRGISHVIFSRREGAHMGVAEVVELTGIEHGEIKMRTVFKQDIRTGEIEFHGLSEEMKIKALGAGVSLKGLVE